MDEDPLESEIHFLAMEHFSSEEIRRIALVRTHSIHRFTCLEIMMHVLYKGTNYSHDTSELPHQEALGILHVVRLEKMKQVMRKKDPRVWRNPVWRAILFRSISN